MRDQIYEELLIAKLSPEMQVDYDRVKAANRTPYYEFGRENALDFFESEVGIMPGANEKHRYAFIVDALGLLLANKQIHKEANKVLFSKNTFVILPEWVSRCPASSLHWSRMLTPCLASQERVHTFWRCENPRCHPRNAPCFIMSHNFLEIQDVYITVQNVRGLTDRMLKVESAKLKANIENIARFFKHTGKKLKTLKIRYSSCFEGQIEAVRSAIEGPLDPTLPERAVMLKDKHGEYFHMSRAEAQKRLFLHGNVLDPLLQLKQVADDVKIRGDLPQAYIDELTACLSSGNPSVSTKKKQRQEHAAQQARDKEPDRQSFFRELRDKMLREGDTGTAELAAQMMRVPVHSPAVMDELFAPPTKEELDRFRVPVNQPAPAQSAAN